MTLKFIYEDKDLLVVDKPAGIPVYSQQGESLMNLVTKENPSLEEVGQPPRFGLVHRLDQDTSGVILIAKNQRALSFLQRQFKQRGVLKKYLALTINGLDYEKTINTLIGRDLKNRTKQKAYLPHSPQAQRKGLREAVTEVKPIRQFEDYTLIEAIPKTGRKHQIRCHLAFIDHPLAGDELYGFKDQPQPDNLSRHFLHAYYLKIKLPEGQTKEFKAKLPSDLKTVLNSIE